MTTRAAQAAFHARQAERAVYGLIGDARGETELREAQDALRLAVGLRRMLERISHRADGDADNSVGHPPRA